MADDDHCYELLHGELLRMTPPGAQHGEISALLAAQLLRHVRQHDLGRVFVETGFQLDQNPDHVRAPDVAFVRKERVPEKGVPVKFWQGPPDFCAEVVSPGDTYAYVQEKARDWIRHGARLVVVVEPDRRCVVVHRSDKDVEILGEDEVLDGGDVMPGLKLAICELIAG
jgi:Uma2 family endonuclease